MEIYKNVGLDFITIWSPLASGLLSGKYNDGIPKGSRFALEGFDWLKERWVMDEKIKKVKKLTELAAKMKIKYRLFKHCLVYQKSKCEYDYF